MRSIAVEAIKTIPGNSNWTYLEHETFSPRLPLDIPQVIFSFVSSLVSCKYLALSEFHERSNHYQALIFSLIKYVNCAELYFKLKFKKYFIIKVSG